MAAQNNECRFCLKSMEVIDNAKIIDEEIFSNFKFVTNLNLKSAANYSNQVCELCLRSLQFAHTVIVQFSENQRKLEARLEKNSLQQLPSSNPLNRQSPSSVVKISHSLKEEPYDEESVIKYIPDATLHEASDYQTSTFHEGNYRAETKLNKEERIFWAKVIDITGPLNPSILYILQMNGYNSVFSFQGHFAAKIKSEDLLTSLRDSVRSLDCQSEHLMHINLNQKSHKQFEFSLGDICLIVTVFDRIKLMINDGSLKSLNVKVKSKEIVIPSKTKYNIDPECLQDTIQEVLRHRTGCNTLEVQIVKASTKQLPYKIFVQCIICKKSLRISITEDKKHTGRSHINIRTHLCVAHLKNCLNL